MSLVDYQFADGHWEKVECSEDFKREYEFMLVQEKALHWKEMKQKARAGLRCVRDLSLEVFSDDGFDLPSQESDPLEKIILQEERFENIEQLLGWLTDKQREAFILYHIRGMTKHEIARILKIDEKSIRRRLKWAEKRILEKF